MLLIRGKAISVRRSAELSHTGDTVNTTHLVTFRINSQTVELAMANVPQIEEGDDVAVAGYIKNGTLKARAYRNWDNGSYGRWHGSVYSPFILIMGCLFLGFVIPWILTVGVPIALIVICMMLYEQMNYRKALRLVCNEKDI